MEDTICPKSCYAKRGSVCPNIILQYKPRTEYDALTQKQSNFLKLLSTFLMQSQIQKYLEQNP